jgi:hypothetical protein
MEEILDEGEQIFEGKVPKIIKASLIMKTNINIFYSIFRYLSKLLLGWISLLTIHSDDYGRAIHDKIGNSVMTIE